MDGCNTDGAVTGQTSASRQADSCGKTPSRYSYFWGVGSDETDRLPQTVMDVQFGIPDPEIDSHVIR